MTVLVWSAERQELSDELVRVGDAVISFSLRQDLLPSIRDSGHLYCRVNTAPHRTKTKLLKALSHCKKKKSPIRTTSKLFCRRQKVGAVLKGANLAPKRKKVNRFTAAKKYTILISTTEVFLTRFIRVG